MKKYTDVKWPYYYYHHHHFFSFMQGIYTYIPETNHVSREYSVSAILSLLFMVSISLVPALALLYFYVSTFRRMCAVPNMAVFCSSFTSWFPGMLFFVFSEWFWNGPNRSYYYCYHLCFYLPHALYFYCQVLIFLNLLGFLFNHISISRVRNIC